MVLLWVWLSTGARADTAYICAPYSPLPTGVACTHSDLATALVDPKITYDTFILEPGLHYAYATIGRKVTVRAEPGAVLTSQYAGTAALWVLGGDGSRFEDLVFDGDLGTEAYPVAYVTDAVVEFDNLQIRNLRNVSDALLWFDANADVTLTAPSIESTSIPGSYGIYANGAVLNIDQGWFAEIGGAGTLALFAETSTVTIDSSIFASVLGSTSFLWGLDSDLTVTGSEFSPGYASFGTPILVQGGSLALDRGTVTTTDLTSVGVSVTSGALDVTGTTFHASVSSAAISCAPCSHANLDGVTVIGSSLAPTPVAFAPPPFTPALVQIYGTSDVSIADAWFCGGGGGALWLAGSCAYGGTCSISRSVFQGGLGPEASAVFASNTPLRIDHSTFASNTLGLASRGAAIHADGTSTLDVSTSLFTNNVGGTANVDAGAGIAFTYNAFDIATQLPTTFTRDASTNPAVEVVYHTLSSRPPRCGASVVVDAARSDPFLAEHQVGAEPVCGAVELPYDGLDEDCDGYEDCAVDADHDGYGTDELVQVALDDPAFSCAPPGDCDDTDPDVNPGATGADCAGTSDDLDGDGFGWDSDCNDADPTIGPCHFVGSGCATSGGPAGGLAAVALLAGSRRRRRACAPPIASAPACVAPRGFASPAM